jgi:hypothetical protein
MRKYGTLVMDGMGSLPVDDIFRARDIVISPGEVMQKYGKLILDGRERLPGEIIPGTDVTITPDHTLWGKHPPKLSHSLERDASGNPIAHLVEVRRSGGRVVFRSPDGEAWEATIGGKVITSSAVMLALGFRRFDQIWALAAPLTEAVENAAEDA